MLRRNLSTIAPQGDWGLSLPAGGMTSTICERVNQTPSGQIRRNQRRYDQTIGIKRSKGGSGPSGMDGDSEVIQPC